MFWTKPSTPNSFGEAVYYESKLVHYANASALGIFKNIFENETQSHSVANTLQL